MWFKINNLKEIDLFGRRTELSMHGKKSHKTWCGTFCTVFIFGICTISAIYYASIFFNRKNPSYMYSEVYDSVSDVESDKNIISPFSNIKIGADDFFAMMGLQNTDYNINDYRVVFTVYSKDQQIAQFQGINCSKTEYFQLLLDHKDISKMSSFQLAKAYPQNFVCLGDDQVDQFKFVYEEQSTITLSLFCDNSQGCQNITGQRLIVLSSDYLLVLQDFNSPLQLYLMDNYIDLDQKYVTYVNVLLQKVLISTDVGFVVENNEYIQQVTFRDFKRYSQMRDTSQLSDPLLLITIQPFSKRQIYDRSYPKIINLLSIVGGLLKSLLVVGYFSTKPFSKISMRSDLVNQLFTFQNFSEKKTPHIHELDYGFEFEEDDEDNLGNKKMVSRSKSMTFSKNKNGQGKLQRIKTQAIKEDSHGKLSVDQLNLQTQTSDQLINQKYITGTGNALETHHNLETPIINSISGLNLGKQNFFSYPMAAYTQESLSMNNLDNIADKRSHSNQNTDDFHRIISPAMHYQSNSSDLHSEEQQFNYFNHQNQVPNHSKEVTFQNDQFTQQSQNLERQKMNFKQPFHFNNGQVTKQSIIMNEYDTHSEDQSNPFELLRQTNKNHTLNSYDNNQFHFTQNTQNTQESPLQQSSPPQLLIHTFLTNQQDLESTTEKNLSSPTRGSVRKGGILKTYKQSYSQSEDSRSTNVDLQKELEQKNLRQRRNANFDRDKKTFVKKETQRNSYSLTNQESQISGEQDPKLSKQPSIKKEITKKETLTQRDSLKKKETIKQRDSIKKKETLKNGDSPQAAAEGGGGGGDTSKMSSSRRIKSFFSTKTKEITNMIRLNLQQRQKQSQEQKEGKNQAFSNTTQSQQQNTEMSENTKTEYQLNKQSTNKQFEGILSEKQEKSIALSISDYIKYFFTCFKQSSKVKSMKYTNKKVKKRLDIIYILEKLIEIDKLKVLLLNPDQINLFDYMPKEFVSSDMNDLDNQDIYDKNNKFANWSLLCAEKSALDKYSNACIAYHHIQQNSNKTKIDKKLIQMLDPQVKRYFNKTLIQPEEMTQYRELLANYSNSEDNEGNNKNNEMNSNQKADSSQLHNNNLDSNNNLNQFNLYQSQMNYPNLISSQSVQPNNFNFGQQIHNTQIFNNNIYNHNNMAQSTYLPHLTTSTHANYIPTDKNRSTNIWQSEMLTSQNGLRYNKQQGSPQRVSHDFNIDNKIPQMSSQERQNHERKSSLFSQMGRHSNTPSVESVTISPPTNKQTDPETLAKNILKNKRSNFTSQKSKTFKQEYCWQAPIIEESNNLQSSEKFGISNSSNIIPKEQISPNMIPPLEERKSQLMFTRAQSITIRTEDENNRGKENMSMTSIFEQCRQNAPIDNNYVMKTEPANISNDNLDEAAQRKFENSEDNSLNNSEHENGVDSPERRLRNNCLTIKSNTLIIQSRQLEDSSSNQKDNLQNKQQQLNNKSEI